MSLSTALKLAAGVAASSGSAFCNSSEACNQLAKKIKSHLQTSLRASVEHRRAVFMGVDETVFETSR